MNNLRQAAQQALEAIEAIPENIEGYLPEALTDAVIDLRQALAEPDYWQEEARRYAGNADYWRKRYKALAEPEQKVWCDCGDSIEPDSGAKCGNCVAGDSAEPEQEPVAWLYTLQYGTSIADRKASLDRLRYPFGVCGADYLRVNSDGTSYVRETPLYPVTATATARPVATLAALAEPEQEPVRLQCTTCGTVYADGVPPQVPEQEPQTTHWEGCEAVHPECRVALRRPLTHEEIEALDNLPVCPSDAEVITFVRKIERAHGIGEQHE